MKRSTAMISVAALALAVSVLGCAGPGEYFIGFRTDIRDAPPPPRLEFDREPRMTLDAVSGVMVLDEPDPGYDMFRYGGYYWVQSDGYWYRCDRYDGSFVVVDAREVPRHVYRVSAERWHHHPEGGPPRLSTNGDERRPDDDHDGH